MVSGSRVLEDGNVPDLICNVASTKRKLNGGRMKAYRVARRITSVPFEARKNKISDLQVRCSPTVGHLGICGRS
jgi:hypothetical protein